MKPYVNLENNIKEYSRSYMVRRCPHLSIPYNIREFRILPRLFNTSIGKIYITPAPAPQISFGSSTKVIFINDFEKLKQNTDPTRCNIIKTIQPYQVLKYLEQGILNSRIESMLENLIAKEVI